ncbi:(5-formylfuran-3-yl)methyl phosphate synthase [Planctomycetota bacterium]
MIQFLVSVRDAAEAGIVCQSGASIIDVKEPDRGSLGRAPWSAIEGVVRTVRERNASMPVSVALGELAEMDVDDCRDWQRHLSGASFAKIGLADAPEDWQDKWCTVMTNLPGETQRVAVAYADWETANAPDPLEVIRFASQQRCRAVLIDTFEKSGGGLLDRLSKVQVKRLIDTIHDNGMQSAMAGSLDITAIETLLPMKPAIVAVRGAVCRGDRTSAIDAERVRSLSRLISEKAMSLHDPR